MSGNSNEVSDIKPRLGGKRRNVSVITLHLSAKIETVSETAPTNTGEKDEILSKDAPDRRGKEKELSQPVICDRENLVSE